MRPRFALLAFSLALTGCVKTLEFGPRGRIEDPAELLELVETVERQVQGLEGEMSLTVNAPGTSGTTGVFLAAQPPGRLHVEVFDFFGKPVSFFVCDGSRYSFAQMHDGRVEVSSGVATAENLTRLVPLPLPPADLVELILGRAPRLAGEGAALAIDEGAAAYVVTLSAEGGRTQRLWIHPLTYRVLRSEVQGPLSYAATFDDFAKLDGYVHPRWVRIASRERNVELTLAHRDVTMNGAIEPALFEVLTSGRRPDE